MGRTLFLSIVTLVVGFCLGLVVNFGLLGPGGGPDHPASSLLPAMKIPAESAYATTAPTSTAAPELDAEDNQQLLAAANQAVAALRDQDYRALADLVHPVEGVLFTPYSTVDPEANLRFTADQIAGLRQDSTKYVWGIQDGKGDRLELTMKDYFARYVYNADFANAPVIGIDHVIGTGNALENVSEVFPDARFVEYYFPGIKPENEGFDWCGLKLVFSVYQGKFKLISVIHSQWTV